MNKNNFHPRGEKKEHKQQRQMKANREQNVMDFQSWWNFSLVLSSQCYLLTLSLCLRCFFLVIVCFVHFTFRNITLKSSRNILCNHTRAIAYDCQFYFYLFLLCFWIDRLLIPTAKFISFRNDSMRFFLSSRFVTLIAYSRNWTNKVRRQQKPHDSINGMHIYVYINC